MVSSPRGTGNKQVRGRGKCRVEGSVAVRLKVRVWYGLFSRGENEETTLILAASRSATQTC